MIPHHDDFRSPVYDLRDYVGDFPGAPGPQSPHGDIITASNEPQCKECGTNHPAEQPCPEMGGGSVEVPVPDDIVVTAFNASDKYDKDGHDLDQPAVECPHCWKLQPYDGHREFPCEQCGESVKGGQIFNTLREAYQHGPPDSMENEADHDWTEDPMTGGPPKWGDEEHHNQQNRDRAWPAAAPHEMMQQNGLSNFEPLGHGESLNEVYTADLQGDGRVIVKPDNAIHPDNIDEDEEHETPIRYSITPGYDAPREHSAAILSRHLDREGARVPTTVQRHVEFPESVYDEDNDYEVPTEHRSGNAIVQHMMHNSGSLNHGNYMDPEHVRSMALLDSMIGNTDRHWGNGLTNESGSFPIDHGLAWPDRPIHEYNGNFMAHNYNTDYLDGNELRSDERADTERLLNHPTMWNEIAQTGIPHRAIDFAQARMRYMLANNRMLDAQDMSAAHGVPLHETSKSHAVCDHCGALKNAGWNGDGSKLECPNGCDDREPEEDEEGYGTMGNPQQQAQPIQQPVQQAPAPPPAPIRQQGDAYQPGDYAAYREQMAQQQAQAQQAVAQQPAYWGETGGG